MDPITPETSIRKLTRQNLRKQSTVLFDDLIENLENAKFHVSVLNYQKLTELQYSIAEDTLNALTAPNTETDKRNLKEQTVPTLADACIGKKVIFIRKGKTIARVDCKKRKTKPDSFFSDIYQENDGMVFWVGFAEVAATETNFMVLGNVEAKELLGKFYGHEIE